MSEAQAVETPQDFGNEVRRWLAEIHEAESGKVAEWNERCGKIEKRYLDESDRPENDRRYSLLWANIETLKPAVYSRQPQPVVATRHRDRDPVARMAAEVLERCLAYSADAYDEQSRMLDARDEYLLYARATLWVRYVARFGPDGESIASEEVVCDFVNRQDWLTNKARTWQEVRWISRRVYMSRDELVARFGKEIGQRVTLDHKVSDATPIDGMPQDFYAKATVYEIWDKPSRRALWLAKGYKEDFLDKRDDPLGLRDFFPCPMPAYGTKTPSSLIPKPDYLLYQDQASEVDLLTRRIGLMADALKVRGMYAGDEKDDIARLVKADDNQLIPIQSWAVLADKGGINKVIEWFPIDMVAAVLKGCIETRRQIIEDVYQITGISDIVRGSSEPSETATAQQIKTQWGSLRIRDRQAELQRLARDVIRIKGEIIAERFGQNTLAAMSGIKLMTEREKQFAQAEMRVAQQQHAAMLQQAQAMGQEPPPAPEPDPETAELLEKPTWDQVIELLRSDPQRRFVIDIETDSTIAADEAEEKERRTEFVGAVSSFIAQAGPVVQVAPELADMMGKMLMFGVRGFHAGRELEDSIERGMEMLAQRAMQPPPQPPVDPSIEAKAQADAAAAERDAQAAQAKMQADQANAQAKLEIDRQKQADDHAYRMAELEAKAQAEMASTQATLQAALQKQADEHHRKMIELEAKLVLDREAAARSAAQQENDHQMRLSEMDRRSQMEADAFERKAASDGDIEGARSKVKKHDAAKAEREQERAEAKQLQAMMADLAAQLQTSPRVRGIKTIMRGPDKRITGAEYDDGTKVGLKLGMNGEIVGTEVLQ